MLPWLAELCRALCPPYVIRLIGAPVQKTSQNQKPLRTFGGLSGGYVGPVRVFGVQGVSFREGSYQPCDFSFQGDDSAIQNYPETPCTCNIYDLKLAVQGPLP